MHILKALKSDRDANEKTNKVLSQHKQELEARHLDQDALTRQLAAEKEALALQLAEALSRHKQELEARHLDQDALTRQLAAEKEALALQLAEAILHADRALQETKRSFDSHCSAMNKRASHLTYFHNHLLSRLKSEIESCNVQLESKLSPFDKELLAKETKLKLEASIRFTRCRLQKEKRAEHVR